MKLLRSVLAACIALVAVMLLPTAAVAADYDCWIKPAHEASVDQAVQTQLVEVANLAGDQAAAAIAITQSAADVPIASASPRGVSHGMACMSTSYCAGPGDDDDGDPDIRT